MLDWDDLRYFLAVARHGNLSFAARELRVSQSTVGRRLASLEASLGVRLLDRTPDGYVSTPAGETVLGKAVHFEEQTMSLERDVGGRDAQMVGRVRVTCAESVASHILAPALAAFRRKHPDIMVELIPDSRELSLSMRKADISVRLTQSKQHDLVIRRIGTFGFAVYASPAYLDEHGRVDVGRGCAGHYLVTQLDDIEDSEQTGWLSQLASHARVAIQTSSHEAAVSAAIHGAGLACLARFRADKEVGLTRIEVLGVPPETGLWLVTHKDNRRNARIRAVLTHITDSVRSAAGQLNPEDSPDGASPNSQRS